MEDFFPAFYSEELIDPNFNYNRELFFIKQPVF